MAVNIVVIVLSVYAVPLYFLVRDVRKTLTRSGLFAMAAETRQENPHLDRAEEVFERHPDVPALVYGHTHRVTLSEVEGRAVINTGTWLKRLTRTQTRIGLLPPVFYPSFRLSYFRITDAEEGGINVTYDEVAKPNPAELSLLQRAVSNRPRSAPKIPEQTRFDP